jgi:group I intron endonuclease
MRTDYLVYTHTRPDTNEIFYVGKGTGKRMKQKSNRSKYWHNIVNKCGSYKAEIIAGNLTEQEALNFEILMIAKMRESGFVLCNLTNGGDGTSGYKHTEEAKQKFSEQRKGRPSPTKGTTLTEEHKQKLKLAKLGKKQSPEHIAAASVARIGMKYSEAHCKAISESLKGKKMPEDSMKALYKQVRCIDTGIVYKSVTAAAKELDLYTTNISKACKGKLTQTGGYRWGYV